MAIKRLIVITFLLAATRGLLSRESINNDKLGNLYKLNITWTGRIDEDSGLMSFTGLGLQHIEEQIRVIKPNFSWSRQTELESQDSLEEDKDNILCDMASNPKFAESHISIRSTVIAQMAQGLGTALVSRARTVLVFGFATIIRILCRYPVAHSETERGT
ncbi:hypothetical protein F4782DRAFT_527861 [Xylaria castorea]|nr:hypothetical protein F4782DRAFT_527861 [Xylaria castorea]